MSDRTGSEQAGIESNAALGHRHPEFRTLPPPHPSLPNRPVFSQAGQAAGSPAMQHVAIPNAQPRLPHWLPFGSPVNFAQPAALQNAPSWTPDGARTGSRNATRSMSPPFDPRGPYFDPAQGNVTFPAAPNPATHYINNAAVPVSPPGAVYPGMFALHGRPHEVPIGTRVAHQQRQQGHRGRRRRHNRPPALPNVNPAPPASGRATIGTPARRNALISTTLRQFYNMTIVMKNPSMECPEASMIAQAAQRESVYQNGIECPNFVFFVDGSKSNSNMNADSSTRGGYSVVYKNPGPEGPDNIIDDWVFRRFEVKRTFSTEQVELMAMTEGAGVALDFCQKYPPSKPGEIRIFTDSMASLERLKRANQSEFVLIDEQTDEELEILDRRFVASDGPTRPIVSKLRSIAKQLATYRMSLKIQWMKRNSTEGHEQADMLSKYNYAGP